mgnify:FL=1
MKVLFLVPHLSTGGMPQFLLKRIQALNLYTQTELFVYEWVQTSKNYTVQREQIIDIVGDNFYSCGYYEEWDDNNTKRQNNLINYLNENNINIVHIEDIAEDFLDINFQKELYNKDNNWKIVETPHSMNYNPNSKILEPDAYCFTITHHLNNTNKNVYKDIIKYPLDTSIVCSKTSSEIKENIGWRCNGEYHILNVGLWTPSKNQGYAIELAKRLWDKYKWTYIFHFVGNQAPNFIDYWEPLMNDLPPNIRIHGELNQDKVSEYLKMSDLMLFTSTWESWGIAIEEAIANEIKIMAHNLDHYGDERIPYIEPLTGDLNKDYELFLNTIHSPRKYKNTGVNSELVMYKFAKTHTEFYKAIA